MKSQMETQYYFLKNQKWIKLNNCNLKLDQKIYQMLFLLWILLDLWNHGYESVKIQYVASLMIFYKKFL